MRFDRMSLLAAAALSLSLFAGTSFAGENKTKTKEAKVEAPAQKATTEAKQPESSLPPVIAKVNGTPIKRKDLELAVKIMLAQNRMGDTAPPEMKGQLESAAAQQLIASELLYQAGQKIELKDLDKQIEEKVAETKKRYTAAGEFEKELKNNGLTEKDLRELTRKSLVINNYIEKEIVAKIAVNEADAKKFYDENGEKFKTDESVRASHILLKADEKATPEEKKKAKEKAEGLLKKVKAGEDFAELAKKESGCPSASVGGDLGYFGKGQMVPQFEKAAFEMKTGDISGIVETSFGYHIIKVTDKKAAGTVDFKEVKPRIEEYLKGQKVQSTIMAKIDELKEKSKIEMMINPEADKKVEAKEAKK